MDDTKRAVYEIIAKIAKKDMAELDSELRLAEDLRMKSVSRIELAALLEDKLGVAIDNFEIRKPKTVGEVLKLVSSKL
jgi:acyl carrier protein